MSSLPTCKQVLNRISKKKPKTINDLRKRIIFDLRRCEKLPYYCFVQPYDDNDIKKIIKELNSKGFTVKTSKRSDFSVTMLAISSSNIEQSKEESDKSEEEGEEESNKSEEEKEEEEEEEDNE